MATIKTPIHEATDQQIRDFCELQQLDVSSAKSRGDLLAVLGPAWEHDFIPSQAPAVLDEDEANAQADQTQSAVPVPGQIVGGTGANDPKVRLKIGNGGMAGGKEPVPVAVNGRTVVIQRNMEVLLPYRYYLALLNAIREDVDQDVKTGDVTTSEVTNYPLSFVSLPSDEEIAAWHERTDNELMPA